MYQQIQFVNKLEPVSKPRLKKHIAHIWDFLVDVLAEEELCSLSSDYVQYHLHSVTMLSKVREYVQHLGEGQLLPLLDRCFKVVLAIPSSALQCVFALVENWPGDLTGLAKQILYELFFSW